MVIPGCLVRAEVACQEPLRSLAVPRLDRGTTSETDMVDQTRDGIEVDNADSAAGLAPDPCRKGVGLQVSDDT